MKKVQMLIIILIIFMTILSVYMFRPTNAAGEQSIADGVYEIEVGVDSNKVLDVINAYTYSGANVQIFTKNSSADCQKVNVKYIGNGYYTLTFLHSNMLLDVANGKTADHTNVWQCRQNGSDAQKWIIKDAGNGYYNIISKSSGKYLTVQNGGTANCTNIEINSKLNNNSQKFKFNKIGRTIEDGIYQIETGVDSNKVLDVINAYTYSGANVQIFTKNSSADCQKVNVKYIGNGYYTLTFLHSNMLLDVANGKTADHTNVWQCRQNGSDAQKWIIKDAGNGYYNIISKSSGKYLTVQNGGTANCTNIEINSKLNNNSQKFKFNKITQNNEIAEGLYEIETGVDSNKALDVINAYKYSGANVQIFTKNKANCQKVIVKREKDGYYTLTFLHSEMLLDVANGKTANHTNVWQCKENGADAQKWKIKYAGGGYYNIISKLSGTYLTVANGGTANCTNIEISSANGTNSQKFKFNKLNELYGTKTVPEGLYEIETGVDSNKALDVIDASKVSGGNVQIFTKNNANCQKVKLTYLGEGYYTIMFLHSNMLLDVANGKTADHTNVWQCRENGSDAQKWIIKDAGNGYYNIISKLSGTYLTVANGSTKNCTNIEINSKLNNNSQKFKFNSTKPNYTINIDSNKYPGYKEAIKKLMKAHPTWNFEFLYTGLKFSNAVYGEYSNHSANLIQTTAGEWLCTTCGTYQYYPGWYGASDKAIAYYMDPRNFLNESNVFQFLDVNAYNSDSVSLEGIKLRVKNTFLSSYVNDINTACKKTNVNPYYVISRLIQENGENGSATSKGMDGGDGKLYYNPFNIGAHGSDVVGTALKRAKAEGWDSMEKAIEGGIKYLKENWLENYQNTLYQNRFDIDSTNGSALYSHQYMQNLSAAYSEAKTLKSCYDNSNKLESYFTFIIPVYEGMSATLSPMPSNEIGVEEYPMNVMINTSSASLSLRESASTNSKIIDSLPKGTVLLSVKRGVNSTWQEVVTKDGKIGYMAGEYLKQVDDEIVCNYQGYIKTEYSGGVNVRTGPSTLSSAGFSKIEYLKDYTKVKVIDETTYKGYEGSDWVQWSRIVLDDGRQAFIPSSYVKR